MSAVARRTGRLRRSAKKRKWLARKNIALVGIALCLILTSTAFGLHHSSGNTPHTTKGQKTSNKTPQISTSPSTPVTPPPPGPHVDSGLASLIATWQHSYTFTSSVVVRELSGNLRTGSTDEDSSMIPASTYKLYVAYAILHGIEQGSYTLNTKTNDGNTIQTDLNNMILNSDNDAARTLGFLYGWKNINALLQSHGMTSTNLYNYVPPSTQPVGDKHTTAADLATMLDKLYSGSLLGQANTQLLLTLMKQQHYRERIPAGVPSGVVVADKPGWLSPTDGESGYTENDAAIVYGPKSTYLLVIMTNGSTTQPLTALSRQIYNYLEN